MMNVKLIGDYFFEIMFRFEFVSLLDLMIEENVRYCVMFVVICYLVCVGVFKFDFFVFI